MKKSLCGVMFQKDNVPIQPEAVLPLWVFVLLCRPDSRICGSPCSDPSDRAGAASSGSVVSSLWAVWLGGLGSLCQENAQGDVALASARELLLSLLVAGCLFALAFLVPLFPSTSE